MKLPLRWTKNTLLFGGIAAWGLLLVSCVSVNRTMVAPPSVAGAKFSGSQACTECHETVTNGFHDSTHAKLAAKGPNGEDIGCEACHGAGSLHVKSGGAAGTIVNPGKSPEACMQCHLDKRGEFSLPHAHGVLDGKMTCTDCHDPHTGSAIKGAGAASLHSEAETCTQCHTAQKGPFIFKHNAMLEGCTTCHSPHGSVNDKMLIARDSNLCLKCHLETTTTPGIIVVGGADHRTRMLTGNCWTAGCHEAVHGSNAHEALRY